MKEKIRNYYNWVIHNKFWDSKLFWGFSAVMIFYFISFDLAYPVNLTIYNFFNGSLFDTKTLEILSNKSFIIHSKLITLGFILMLFLIFRKSINLALFTLVVLFVFSFPVYEFIDFYIHEALFDLGIYKPIIRTGATAVNPQYTRILLFVLGFIAISVLVVKKNTRTMDRVFMFLVAGSMVVTTFFFHLAIPMGTFKLAKTEKMNEFVKNMVDFPIGYACKNKNCFILNEDFKVQNKIILNNTIKDNIQNNFIKDAELFFKKDGNKMSYYFNAMGNFIGTDMIFSSCLYKIREKVYLCSFDNTQLTNYGYISKLWFSLLTAIAHFTWIFLGFGLLFLHKQRMIQKIVTSKMNQSKESVEDSSKSTKDLEITPQE